MKILMAFSDYGHTPEREKQNTYGGVGYYRIIKPAQNIKGHEVKVIGKEVLDFGKTLEEQYDNLFKSCDIFWTNASYVETAGAACVYHAQKHGKKFVMDIDDNYLDVPESNKQYEKFKAGKKERAFLSTILSFADAITVSTKPLKEKLQKHFKEVHGVDKEIFVIPNMNDLKDWNFPHKGGDGKQITIGYVGSNSHYEDLKMFLPQLAQVMNVRKNVYFEVIGAIEKNLITDYFKEFTQDARDRCVILPATPTFKQFPEWLSEQRWDFAVAPLIDTPFTRSKSHIKWMEYSSFKIPTIASRVYPYFMDIGNRKVIEDGKTGRLVKSNEWVRAINEFIDRPEYAKLLGENAYRALETTWQYDSDLITDVVNKIIALPKVKIEIPEE